MNEEKETSQLCPNCKKAIASDSGYCPHCSKIINGRSIKVEDALQNKKEEKSKRSRIFRDFEERYEKIEGSSRKRD
ncbi:MAG: hypothetical protein JSW00_05535, partial [Thermoplasmata archaeon]